MSDKLKSRKFWLAIFGAVLPIINDTFKIGLNPTEVVAAVAALAAFIIGESAVDAAGAAKPPEK